MQVARRRGKKRAKVALDHLGRLFTTRELARKAASDAPFDIAWLERALPPRPATGSRQFSLLDTPRRLAHESHRQAHCIVSYTERFRRGALGGVSVLTGNGQRWTVTIKPPADGGKPSINQIYGRRNRTPDWTTRRKILDILGPGIADTPCTSDRAAVSRAAASPSDFTAHVYPAPALRPRRSPHARLSLLLLAPGVRQGGRGRRGTGRRRLERCRARGPAAGKAVR